MSVVSRAMMLAQSALIGFGQGFQPVCGFNYGAGLYHRVKEGFRFCVKWSTVFLTAVSVLGLVLAPQIIAVFRNDPEVIAFGARALRLQCLAFPLCGVIVISSMLTQTINKVWQASVLAVAGRGCSSSRRCWPCPISGGSWGCSWPSRCRTCAPSP